MSLIPHIHIAYGSESGNAEKLAQQLAIQPFLLPYSPTFYIKRNRFKPIICREFIAYCNQLLW